MKDDEYYKRDTNRDTHFQGFANLLWEDIGNKLEFWIDTAEPNFTEELKLIFARRAYDLACHIVEQANVVESRFVENVVAGIPDLDSWPITTRPKPD